MESITELHSDACGLLKVQTVMELPLVFGSGGDFKPGSRGTGYAHCTHLLFLNKWNLLELIGVFSVISLSVPEIALL